MKPQDPNSQPKNKPQNLVNLPEHIIKTATMWTLSSAYVISLILGNCLERITRETDTLTENKVARHQTPVHERVGGGPWDYTWAPGTLHCWFNTKRSK